MVPLVGTICICTNLIASGTIGKEIGANGKNGNTCTNSTKVTLGEPRTHTHTLFVLLIQQII